ncbi:IreB family regulatory phosphoprotein [Anaerococcus sp. AGMB00486]|uniref:IreB family regulatory phosphoprotein n=2 Tax=Anaerococcus TaxID=165779 RepID=A0ABX2N7E6_9FIRM|nr:MULTISPECIES: IreB family regulatory phosphoprotein [Anaerococcus]MDY3005476.1 IreB family regulatory phosphoprotein [Anaerococcus porci]MSS76904.1 IreB family regulatory phosphoprotein [Anaerococcus porci]NVF10612.1 IreB family regulatory phosphoprotein [Anaerococcus faecalis]
MSDNNFNETMRFKPQEEKEVNIREILTEVYKALEDKGYKPTNQIIGYLMSGDPTYITGHNNARKLIRQVDRDTILEEIINYYINE